MAVSGVFPRGTRKILIFLVSVHVVLGIMWGALHTTTVFRDTSSELPVRIQNASESIINELSVLPGKSSTLEKIGSILRGKSLTLDKLRNGAISPVISLTQEGIKNASASFLEDLNYLNSGKVENESKVAELFVQSYSNFCQNFHTGVEGLPLCPCVSTNLVGRQNLSEVVPSKPNLTKIENTHPEVTSGGHWKPGNCAPRHKIAIIIPYRNRTLHLHSFLYYMIPFLQRQLVEFTIFVVEQGKPDVFNKASLMNIGFLEARKPETFDCFCFNDVDTLPEDDRNFYTCTGQPHHLAWYVNRWNYKPFSGAFVGGGSAFTAEQFRRINGFSNRYYGWGGEDDDTYHRILNAGMQIVRFPKAVARFTALGHQHDDGNPVNVNRVRYLQRTQADKAGKITAKDGLNNIKYDVTEIEKKPLFTLIRANLPPPPKESRFRSWDPPKKES